MAWRRGFAPVPAGQSPATTQPDAVLIAVQGWMPHLGPVTASEIGGLLGLPPTEIEKALLRMEASGAILRGKFRPDHSLGSLATDGRGRPSPHEIEWCERRLLARIHRLTVATLRKQIAPVTASQFMSWLLRWQHVAPGTQVRGEHGTLEVIRQLQGFEIPGQRVGTFYPRRAESPTTILQTSTSCAWPARSDGAACRRIRPLSKPPEPTRMAARTGAA